MAKHKIALIPGDGIGKEVLPEGVRVLEAAARRFNFQLEFTEYDWSCDRFAKTGKMMPDDGMETLKQYESIFLGAVGWPGVPDHVSLWGLLIPIRREFDEYVNLRPVRLFEGVPSPLANRKPGDIDFWVVRENTEGEYSSVGGRMFQGTDDEMAIQQAIFTRKGVDRVLKFAFDFASYDYYEKHGRMMPEDWKDKVGRHDAIYFGAVGWPAKVPDHISLWGSLILFRREFDQYINLRPVRLMPGVPSPLANRKPGDIDFWVVRENTEGEYSGAGGRIHAGKPHEAAVQTIVHTRAATERVMRFAFEWAVQHGRKRVTSVTKSNSMQHNMVFWDDVFAEISATYPAMPSDKQLVDSMTVRMVDRPETLDVFVASNLFGDILTDLGAALTGSLGLAPSANLNPERAYPSLFQAIHGSAFDLAGKNAANPIASIWSAQMMLEFLGEPELASLLMRAIETLLREKKVRTRDLGGSNSTSEVADAICDLLQTAAAR